MLAMKLIPVATDQSLGEEVTFHGASLPVLTGDVPLRGVDVVFLCLPADAASPWIRQALGASIPCIDLSGSLAARSEVPVVVADLAPAAEDLRSVVAARTDGAWADVAFDAAGVPAVVEQLFGVLGAGGRLEVVAIHTKPVNLDITAQLTMQERVLGSSVGYANDHVEAIELVRSGKVDLAPFVTSRIIVDDIVKQGYERLTTHKEEVKILVSMH